MVLTLKERAYTHIRDGLSAGRWVRGRMLSPSQMAKMIGMSLTPVREAILQLENEGLVEVIPKVGVRPRELNRVSLQQMFEFRMILERSAGELAAQRMTQEQLTRLEAICREHSAVLKEIRQTLNQRVDQILRDQRWIGPLRDRSMKVNHAFHNVILKASDNPWLIKSVDDLYLLTQVHRKGVLLPGTSYLKQLSRDYGFHRRICRAIRKRDIAGTGRWITAHLQNAMAYHLAVHDYLQETNGHEFEGTGIDGVIALSAGPGTV